MRVPRTSFISHRPSMIRVGPTQVPSIHGNSNIGSFNMQPMNNRMNRRPSNGLTKIEDSLRRTTRRENTREKRRKRCSGRKAYCYFCLATIVGLILGAAMGLLLAFELPKQTVTTATTTTSTTSTSSTSTTSTTTTTTTTSTSSTSSTSTTSTTTSTTSTSQTTSTTTSATTTTTTVATTTPTCGTNPNTTGVIFTIPATSAPSTYTLYSYGFTATDSSATLTFAMTGDAGGNANNSFLLDSVSVINMNTSINVLINGGFETGDFTGWTQYCNTDSNCDGMVSGVYYGHLITSSCYSGTYCYTDGCSKYDYLLQSFSTVIGDYYLISFYFREFVTGGPQTIYVTLT